MDAGNSGGIDANVGGNVDNKPILRPFAIGLLDHRLVGLEHRHRRVRTREPLRYTGPNAEQVNRMASDPVPAA
jgi:hypothetical protein